MKHTELLALFDREQRIEIEYPDMVKEITPQIVRFRRPAPGMNFIQYSRLDENIVEAVITEQVEYLRQFDQPFEWKVYAHDQPPDLKDRLAARGFKVEDQEAVMILELANTPPALLATPTVEVKTINHRSGLGEVVEILEKVWGGNFEWVYARLGGHLEIPGYLKVYVAFSAGNPACCGWIYFHPHSQFASLWGGSTIPGYRGQGLYTAILAVRVQDAIARYYRLLTIDSSPMSRPIVERNGFRLLTYAHDCQWGGNQGE